jgi:hypothetical protein
MLGWESSVSHLVASSSVHLIHSMVKGSWHNKRLSKSWMGRLYQGSKKWSRNVIQKPVSINKYFSSTRLSLEKCECRRSIHSWQHRRPPTLRNCEQIDLWEQLEISSRKSLASVSSIATTISSLEQCTGRSRHRKLTQDRSSVKTSK